ncbi:flavin-containing monooxygenase [Gordonia sp. NPDC003376]
MRPDNEVLIVGAGFGGIGAAIEFTRLGIDDVAIVEREDDLGGTWHVNHYPGLAVDIASVTYSYSFEPNPFWSRLFAPGAELKRYAEHVAEKYDLTRRMEFGTTVTGAHWDDDSGLWVVATADGATRTCRYLVTATGFLSQPSTPDFPGMDTFTGTVLHTAAWDDSVDLTGRRVAVIGTGATAVQLIPEAAKVATELTVFQRTPIWVVPKIDFPIPRAVQRLFARIPLTQRAVRLVNTSLLEVLMVFGVLHFRQARLGNKAGALLAKAHLRAQVPDADLRRRLTPHYDLGCKRPTFSNSYFRAYTRSNVTLETEGIGHIEPDAVVTGDGRRVEIDTLVLATGFDLWDTNFPAFEIIGCDQENLGRWWRESRFQAYQGITMPRFPNLLSLNSPYSYSGLSYFTTIEGQMRHIARLFGELRRRGASTFEVTGEANDAFLDEVTGHLADSVFYRGDCAGSRSYYFNHQGEAALLRPNATLTTLHAMDTFPLDDYRFR